MNVSQTEFQNMRDEIVKDLVCRLVDDYSMPMESAFDAVYNSLLFEKLGNQNTGLYFQSSGYVFSYLVDELLEKQVLKC